MLTEVSKVEQRDRNLFGEKLFGKFPKPKSEKLTESRSEEEVAKKEKPKIQPIRVEKQVGRNDPCPCGSGKKYKNCHGQMVEQ